MAQPPLKGIRVVELAGLAPGTRAINTLPCFINLHKVPYATLLLAEYGASVLRIDRPHPGAHSSVSPLPPPTSDLLSRRKSSIAIDLKSARGIALLRSILKKADVFIEPFRPGVLESLGLSPTSLLAANPRLIIARLTGFRRDGKYAKMAGHDINYLAVSGMLSQMGRNDGNPYAPANILADFAGGGLMCAYGIMLALFARDRNGGRGQIVESNMVDGVQSLGTMTRLSRNKGLWNKPRGENLLDGGVPWYEVYKCRGGGYMAVGALEPKFFDELLKGLALSPTIAKRREDPASWPVIKFKFQQVFLTKPREEWEKIFDELDACCTPVLTLDELDRDDPEQRPAVGLTGTPALKISQDQAWNSEGLAPGVGGEERLREWFGWKRGQDYDVENGGLVNVQKARL
ncbi:hypothetical protein MMC25_004075 [Agyrium rufum]|nr:hypothetical protein [Agyrium rufum]